MAQELTLKTHHNPGYFNKDTMLGGMLGLFIGNIALNSILPGAGFIAAAVGGVTGGILGKKRLEKENAEGKAVGEPSFWSKDTLIGGLIGLMLSGIAALATGLVTLGGVVAAPAAAPVIAGIGLVAMAAALVGAPLLGAYIGGKHGKAVQAREYEQAKQQHLVQDISQNLSPEIAQAVEYKMGHDKQWAQNVLQKKLQAAAQENVRT